MTTKSLTFDDCVIILSLTLTDNPLKSYFSCGDLNTINYVFETVIFNLLEINPLLISERQLCNFEIASNVFLDLNDIIIGCRQDKHANQSYDTSK